jgi:hypothetical protein
VLCEYDVDECFNGECAPNGNTVACTNTFGKSATQTQRQTAQTD